MKSINEHKLIILVDDDETNNFICKKMLSIFDPTIETKEFMDPTVALQFLNSSDTSNIRLLLLDLNMPKLNGWQFLEKMSLANSDVVILSSSIDPNDVQKAKSDTKIKDFWTKPLTLDMLGKYFAA